ncbi:MAG TPA: hypothetical protein VLT16_11830, partial [Candidatus Limnocylindrales bacterium]|nr:hypothetical protein [Candidatus Limnocylindrales bacterium]
ALCLLLPVILSGTLLTYLFDRSAPLAARLCMGACLGPAIFATLGFLFADLLGMGAVCLWASAGTLLLPGLLLFRADFRKKVAGSIAETCQAATEALRHPDRRVIAFLVFYLAIAILLGKVFAGAAYQNEDGIFTAVTNNLGDLPLHLQVISSFVQGQNFPPQDPTFAGVRFAYPFLCDVLTAMLVRAGAGIISAMWLQNMVLALALTGLMHYWTVLLTRSRAAGFIAPLLVLFSGGLGWTWILMELHSTAGGLFTLLGNLQHDYTIMPESILRWGNSLTTLFVPQRSILFGMPLALVIFCQWWCVVGNNSDAAGDERHEQRARWRMAASGAMAGLLPLIHAHTFLVVIGIGACLAVIFRHMWRSWVWFFAVALPIALPEVLWLARSGTISAGKYIGWHPGWDSGGYNPVLFWLVNGGFFLVVLVVALLWRSPSFALPEKVFKFYAPFLLCFIVPNLITLAPWVWDNIKVLFYWYIASAPLVAWAVAQGMQRQWKWRWAAWGALAAMLLSGSLDVWRVVSGTTAQQEFNIHDLEMAQIISRKAGPHAVVLHAPTYNTPVFLTGRRSLLGYPGWMWSRGLDYSQRESDIRQMYSGGPQAQALLQQYHVGYALVGPEELAQMKVNEQFWSQYPKVAEIAGGYRLYKTNVEGERAGK